MSADVAQPLRASLAALDRRSPGFATDAVALTLDAARKAGASDVHWQPGADALEVRWRIDGVLHPAAALPIALAPNVIARLKVLADLLTYRTDTPQEGRIRAAAGEVEMRVSTFPTLFGEKAVVRVFAETGRYQKLDELGLPADVHSTLRDLLAETSGMIVLSGPAGAGKTTTIYACLRALVESSRGTRSLASLEDPIEVAISGVAQSQVNPGAGFGLAAALRSVLRQDPEVIAVGEIRDRDTAEAAFGASLTGHLVLTTFHSGGAAGAVGRLSDMGIEPYVLRSGLLAVVGQRLVRRLCPSCSREARSPDEFLGLRVARARVAVGCPECGGSGYRGRAVIAEILVPGNGEVGRAILDRTDVSRIEAAALAGGMVSRWSRAARAVEDGVTSPAEVRRVLGFRDEPAMGDG